MPTEDKETQERLTIYSQRIAANATQVALAEQRLASLEKLVETYHRRIHELENDVITMKVVQTIHDTDIKGVKKIMVGNGTRDTIPMDIQRLETNIQNILKVDWQEMQGEIEDLKKVKDRAWQIAVIILGLIISNIWQWVVR